MSEDTYEEVLDALEEIEELEESGEVPPDLSVPEKVLTKKNTQAPKNDSSGLDGKSPEKKKTQDKTKEENKVKPTVSEKPRTQEKKPEKMVTMAEKTQEGKKGQEKPQKDAEKTKEQSKEKKKDLAPKPNVPGKEEEMVPVPVSPKPVLTTPEQPAAGVVPGPRIDTSRISVLEGEIKALKDSNKDMSEKIDGFGERIGEIRGQVMERETTIREALISLKKMGEVVSELDPMRLIRDKRKMNAEITILQSKVDEYERLIKDLSKKFAQAKETIDAVTDIHTVLELGKDVGKRLQMVEEIRVRIDRMLHKIESMYQEINKRFEQLPLLIGKIEKFDALSMEIMKILDEYKVRMEGFLVNQDLDPIRTDVQTIREELQEVEQRATKRPLSVKESSSLESYKKMITEELEAIRATNSIIEEQYREAMISEPAFNELMKKNREREAALEILLKDINR
jgi:hypothetical protein